MQLRAMRDRLAAVKKVERGEDGPSLREIAAAGILIERPAPANTNTKVYSSNDYESGELVTHGQSCIWIVGESALATALLNGTKPHNALGATMLGVDYAEFQKRFKLKEPICVDARQAAKPPNFGFPGGMGAVKLVLQQRIQGPNTPHPSGPLMVEDEDGNKVRGYKGLRFCVLVDKAPACGREMIREWKGRKYKPVCKDCVVVAERLKKVWFKTWPENRGYFDFIQECVDHGQVITPEFLALWPHLAEVFEPYQQLAPGEIMQHVNGRVRGGVDFNSAANGFFQGLLAAAATAAYRRVGRECYDRNYRVPRMAHANSIPSRYAGAVSPLLGSRPTVFLHDELLCEHPYAVASDAAMRVAEIMIEELRACCPDLADACLVEPALMRRWLKAAKAVWADDHGGLTDANGQPYTMKSPGVHLIPWEPEPLLRAA